MKRIAVSLLFLVILHSSGFSQIKDVKIKWTKEMQTDPQRSLNSLDILGKDKEGFYVVNLFTVGNGYSPSYASPTSTISLEKYNYNMDKVFSKDLEIKYLGHKTTYYFSHALGNNYYVFTTYWDNERGKFHVLSTLVSPTGELGKANSIFETSRREQMYLSVYFDSTRIMFIADLEDKEKFSDSYFFKVMDQQVNKIWEDTLTFPYKPGKMFPSTAAQMTWLRYSLDNNSNLHILAKIKREEEKKLNYDYKLFSYLYQQKEPKEYLLNKGVALTSVDLTLDKQGVITATGFYSSKLENPSEGFLYIKIDPAMEYVHIYNEHDFDQNFMAKLIEEKEPEKRKGLRNYIIKNTEIDKEGNTIILAEQDYFSYGTNSLFNDLVSAASSTTTSSTERRCDDILIVKFSPQGDLLWSTMIPKNQKALIPYDSQLSYAASRNKSTLSIIYNEQTRKLKELDSSSITLTDLPATVIVVAMVDSTGQVSRKVLTESGSSNASFKPSTSRHLSEGELIIWSVKGRKYKIAKIQF